MAQIPNLDNAPINLISIREQSQKELINILKNIQGKKCLVIDPKLGDSLSLIIQTSLLKEHGVELRHLSADHIQTDCTKVVYLVRSQPNLMRHICSNIHHDESKGLQREYHVYFVPHRTIVCEKVLEEEKLHNMVTIEEYPLYIVPMDEDVLSFELDLAYKECQVDGDTSSLWHIAKAIHKLEFSFGVIPNLRAKGKASMRVADILNRMQAEEPVNSSDIIMLYSMVMPEINTLILLDREFLNIKNGSIELDVSIMGLQQEGKKKLNDKLFKEIWDLNFEVVVQILRQKATSMKQDYTEMTTTSQSVFELKDFVKKLNSLPEITRHINLAQHLTTFTSKPSFLGQLDMEHTIVESQSYDICFDYIEELIHKQEPLTTVLRLLILFFVTNYGRELLHSYGFEHITTLNNLEKAGLFKKQESRSNQLTIKRALQLVVEDTDIANPNDISYVFSGYAPLSIRLIQHAIRSGWRPVEEILKLLPGPHLETKRGAFSNSPSFDSLSEISTGIAKVSDGRRALCLLSLLEVLPLQRFLLFGFSEGMAYDLIIATTKIVNGQTLVETFMEKLVLLSILISPVPNPNSRSRSLTLLHNKCIQIEERGKQGERGKRRETALAGASPPSPSLSSVKGGEERACIQERRDAVCRHRRRPGARHRAASRRRPVHGPTSLRYCRRSVHKPSSMGQNREERERDTRREAHDQPCRRQRRGLPSPSSRAATASLLLSCSTAVVALCCCRVSPSRRWRRKARQFCFCLWVLESEKTPLPLLFVGFKIIAATGITNRKGEEAVFCCRWCCHRTVEAIADYDFVIWLLNVPNPAVLDIPESSTLRKILAVNFNFLHMLVGDDLLMFNAKRIERVVLEYAGNALFLKSKVQKQPIRQNPEVTLCCDVRCKIVGRSEEPNVYISNEQTTAAATLSFIQTSISWKHNFCLPVLVPSRDPKSCESRNPMCSKPTPAFKKSQSVMDDDLLLMVRSGFAVAAVPVLATEGFVSK
ncbi:hypothetical protein Ahy_B03g066091 isoform D [Arachis hypogaea]|uniref:Uncharacterized protein n=1 Tax=Arachis hypogaea TaxID=3818 RepID=A0A445A3C2_ARAHY|nr:hypothetical protein Ahy_B03g066091 isoform D [Arachis hypogaea]